ncbi:MAG: ABC transporter ATP-binding protein [Nanoarchaeota archaeon]|nr:ABC transporter ATP-binding protein [Nanoarchaeota archaeon]MCG2718117.1 ABC transporter ATP-binding protein [Nanoarchaeota archaeon]
MNREFDTPIIEVEKVSKKFGKIAALSDVSFPVERGYIFGYLGPNGAGKTTTIRIMLGLISPDEGSVKVFGYDSNTEINKIMKNVGVVLEHPGLYDDISAYENLEYYAKIYKMPLSKREKKIQESLETANLWDRKDAFVRTFSMGMRKKLAIARALLHDPELIIFDEPTSGLDPVSQKMVRDMLVKLVSEKKRTVFLSSHNLDEVQKICSNIGILNSGMLVACDTVEKLRKKFSNPAVEIRLSNYEDVKDKIEQIKTFGFVREYEVTSDKLMVFLDDAKNSSKLIELLVKEGFRINEAKIVLPSVEDVYVSLMGDKK